MTITIDLEPDVEAQLQAQAKRRGVSVPDYVEQALTSLADNPVLLAFLTAPEDDEEETEEERAAVEEAFKDVRAGRLRSHRDVFVKSSH